MGISIFKIASAIGSTRTFRVDDSSILGYKRIIQTTNYDVFERSKFSKPVIAAYGFMAVVKVNDSTIKLYPDIRCRLLYYTLSLSSRDKDFPNILEDSKILSCTFIPYMREVEKDRYIKSVRLCVITDKAQIYHNYPSRSKSYAGYSLSGDFARFEESVVWDIPGRKYPSKDPTTDVSVYYPFLPDLCYEHHPVLNSSALYRDIYGNGGFPEYKTISKNGIDKYLTRFYLYSRRPQANPFHFIGGSELDCKMSMIGTYRSNVAEGVRTCLFVSDDGGRQWYCKYEFADYGDYEFQQGHSGSWGRNFGNPIKISDTDVNDFACRLIVSKRELVLPDSHEDRAHKFNWIELPEIVSCKQQGRVIMTACLPHSLCTGNIIAINSVADDVDNRVKWMLNPNISKSSAGNSILFKVEVLDNYSFALYELVSAADNNIPCRHIHHINSLKDGWIIGTGEIYPNSWLLYMQVKERDTFARVSASDDITTIRLNYHKNSIQRSMGVILYDDEDLTLLYASDHDTLNRPPCMSDNQGKPVSRNSTGIYKGKWNDINDYSTFQCVFESSEPCYYFQKISDMLVFAGQRGHLGLFIENHWFEARLNKHIMYYYGNCGNLYFFNDYAILRK